MEFGGAGRGSGRREIIKVIRRVMMMIRIRREGRKRSGNRWSERRSRSRWRWRR